MRHLRRFAACLLVSVSVSVCGVGATTASAALPEFVPVPAGFESLLKATKLETVGKTKVTCKKGGDAGKGIGPKELDVTLFLQECKIPGALCTSAGAVPGEIVTPTLLGTLGYIHKVPKAVGLDLTSPSGPIMQFMCGATPFVVTGSVIGKIGPLNKPLPPGTPFKLVFAQKEGKQKYPNFEGEPPDVLLTSIGGGPLEESGLSGVDEIFFVGTIAIQA
jgi:hypothetical protein